VHHLQMSAQNKQSIQN